MKQAAIAIACLITLSFADTAFGYPLDAGPDTGITRLEGYSLIKNILLERGRLEPGSLLTTDEVRLRLADGSFQMPAPDPEFTARVQSLLGSDVRDYGVSVLDFSDPGNPRLAEVNGGRTQNPGSVGKIMVALGWFQALADLHPNDIEARKKILRETQITASNFIISDDHNVPFWKPGDPMVVSRPIEIGDTANLWSWMDWMMSASSNAAASQLIAELILFREFGAAYPVSEATAAAFFANTPGAKLTQKLREAIMDPAPRSGVDLGHLRQGSLFTREGKRRIVGTSSYSTSTALLDYLARMEQGLLVDRFSSLEIKKLLYLTDNRIRYASAEILKDSAVYFKSGSLYSCKPEPGYACEKYMGNKWNFLNSATLVETHDPKQPLAYIVVILSNVLKKNSADEHRALATELHRLIESRHPAHGASDRTSPGGAAPEPVAAP